MGTFQLVLTFSRKPISISLSNSVLKVSILETQDPGKTLDVLFSFSAAELLDKRGDVRSCLREQGVFDSLGAQFL